MKFNQIEEKDKAYIAGTYGRAPVAIVKGSGATCEDSNGKTYTDFSSGIGVNSLGFQNPYWVKAVTDQLGDLSHISNLYYTLPQVKLAEELCKRTGFQKVFFSNSGAEANEGAIKTARKYSSDKYGSQRHEIITLENSFHGRTIATLAATGQDVFHEDFGPFPTGFSYAKANDIQALKDKITPNTCGIFLELIQGEGGVIPLEEEYVKQVVALCKEGDILLLVDEVQTGVGRTGKLLCSEWFGIKPDILTLAKGLGGGLPIGAVLFGDKTKDVLGISKHGTTFGGNPIITAGALAVLQQVDEALLQEVVDKSDYIFGKLALIKGVKGVTGKGLMIGIELEDGLTGANIQRKLLEEGIIFLTAKHKLRLLPPLTISYEEISKGLDALKLVLGKELEQ